MILNRGAPKLAAAPRAAWLRGPSARFLRIHQVRRQRQVPYLADRRRGSGGVEVSSPKTHQRIPNERLDHPPQPSQSHDSRNRKSVFQRRLIEAKSCPGQSALRAVASPGVDWQGDGCHCRHRDLVGVCHTLSRGSPGLLLIITFPLLVVYPSRTHLRLALGWGIEANFHASAKRSILGPPRSVCGVLPDKSNEKPA